MSKLLILEQFRSPENSIFSRVGSDMGIHVHSVDPADLSFQEHGICLDGEVVSSQYDAVVIRTYRRFAAVRQIARSFSRVSKPVLGVDPMHPSFTQDKLCDLMDLQDAAIPVPRTWARVEDAPQELVVAKENWGYGGAGVAMVDLSTTRERLRSRQEWVNHHFQEFLPAKEDWRVLICEGKPLPLVIVRRPLSGEFRTNTHQGGISRVLPANMVGNAERLMDIATRAARVLGRQCAGVDMRQGSNGQPVVLEVNRTPRLRLGTDTNDVAKAYLTTWQSMIAGTRPGR